jgi:hypothetical protein
MGFKDVKRRVISDLISQNFLHEPRGDAASEKNKLQTGEVTVDFVAGLLKRCRETHCSSSPHHGDNKVVVYVVIVNGWYIKFYFVDPSTMFISVHEEGQHGD